MTQPVELTVHTERSELPDGSHVWTASIAELPGVVAEGESQATAVTELMALTTDLHERVGTPVIGFRTPCVAGWSWMIGITDSEAVSYGAPASPGAIGLAQV